MFLRPFKIVASTLAIVLSGASYAAAAASAASKEAKFLTDLESLLGASVKTSYGEMAIRQRKDEFGRVRKQLIVGKDFQEIQLDQDGDGTVDFWMVRNASKTVEASQPSHGRFLRLEIKDRIATGLQSSTYLLNLDGRAYTLLSTKFTGKNVRARGESAPNAIEVFQPDDLQVPMDLSLTVLPDLMDVKARDERFFLQEENWKKNQKAVLDKEGACEEADPVSQKLAELQRDWWKILTRDVANSKAILASKLKASTMFGSSCKAAANKAELERMADALASVMMSSSKGEPKAKDGSRGSYLTCLENSGLGSIAAKMEVNFLSGLNDRYRTTSLVTCEFKPGAEGGLVPGEATTTNVIVHMTASEEGKQRTNSGSTQNYENSLFHEMMHVAGIPKENEKLVHAAQACCGDPSLNKVFACDTLDSLVFQENRLNTIVTYLSRVDGGTVPFVQTLESVFGAIPADELNRAFFLEMEDADPTILNNAAFTACAAESGEAVCRQKWTDKVSKYFDDFFNTRCKKIVPGEFKSQCKKVASATKAQMVKTIATSMIYVAPATCKKSVAEGDRPSEAASWNQAFVRLTRILFGTDAAAGDEVDCGSSIAIPGRVAPVPNVATADGGVSASQVSESGSSGLGIRMRGISTPNTPTTGAVAGTSARDDSSVGHNQPRQTVPARSPLPVTKVESSGGGRVFAEDRYRRATDFAGVATKGFERARDLILPAAVAASEASKNSSGSRSRLSPDASFIAFKPVKGEQLAVKLDNPFSSMRSVASIGDIQSPSAGANQKSDRSGSSSSSADSGTRSANTLSGTTSSAEAGEGTHSAKGRVSSGSGDPGSSPGSASAASGATAKNEKPAASDPKAKGVASSVLEGLFDHPYREIEPRLNQLAVVEAMISEKYSVVDAQKRKVGSSHPVHCYDYVGMERPLRKLSKCKSGKE